MSTYTNAMLEHLKIKPAIENTNNKVMDSNTGNITAPVQKTQLAKLSPEEELAQVQERIDKAFEFYEADPAKWSGKHTAEFHSILDRTKELAAISNRHRIKKCSIRKKLIYLNSVPNRHLLQSIIQD